MKLDDWCMQNHPERERELARALKCNTKTIYKYRRGQRIPNKRPTMQAIYVFTAGAVDANEFFGVTPSLLEPSGAAQANGGRRKISHGKTKG